MIVKECKMDNPKVSIIMPCYNVGKYLDESMNSVLDQTYKNIEIICIDDGSKDDTLIKLNFYKNKDSRIKVYTQKNSGQSAARNIGYNNSEGKYIYYFDSDDLLSSNTIKECVYLAEKNNLDLVQFNAECIKEIEIDFHPSYRRIGLIPGEIYFPNKDYFDKTNFIGSVCINFIKKEILEKNSIFFVEGMKFEDTIFMVFLLCSVERIGYIDKDFFKRRIRDNSTMTEKGIDRSKDMYLEYEILKEYLLSHKELDKSKKKFIKEEMMHAYIACLKQKRISRLKIVLNLYKKKLLYLYFQTKLKNKKFRKGGYI